MPHGEDQSYKFFPDKQASKNTVFHSIPWFTLCTVCSIHVRLRIKTLMTRQYQQQQANQWGSLLKCSYHRIWCTLF